VNAYIEYLTKKIALKFRRNMTHHFHRLYIKDLMFYQLTNIDSRIDNPDQRLTQDIEKWSVALSNLYINFTKPLLDLILFSQRLATYVTWKGPFYGILTYSLSSLCLRYLSPAFGKMRAVEQILEGEYRKSHTDLIYWSEEIAFQKGSDWEKTRINKIYGKLTNHIDEILSQKLWMGTFDSMMVKYGATLCGFAVLGIPVFGSGSEDYLEKMKSDPSGITRDYIRNSSLLINLSKAIGRIAISYKELQNLAGYSHLINEMDHTLYDLNKGNYVRNQMKSEGGLDITTKKRGEFVECKGIRFEKVPIVSPNGDVLVKSMDFEVILAYGRSFQETIASSLAQTDAERVLPSESLVSSGLSLMERSSDQNSKSFSTYHKDLIFQTATSEIRLYTHTSNQLPVLPMSSLLACFRKSSSAT
jgi:ATP-binding cassette subfamily D (ALD) protein 3